MKKLLKIFLFTQLLISCSSVKYINPQFVKDYSFDYQIGDTIGTFKNNFQENDFEGYSLWKTLNSKSDEIIDWEKKSVRIIICQDSFLKVQLLEGGFVIEEKLLKGEIQKEFYQLKSQTKYNTIIVFALYGNSSAKFTISENGDLITIKNSIGLLLLGGIVPIFGAAPASVELMFERIS